MTRLARPLSPLILGLGCLPSFAREYEGSRTNPVQVNGAWEFAIGDGTEGAEPGAGRILFSQLDLQGRLDRSKPNCDPVAERILLRLPGAPPRSEEKQEPPR